MTKYEERKNRARAEAVNYQLLKANSVLTWGAIAEYEAYFIKLGKRYGLLKEFRENAII